MAARKSSSGSAGSSPSKGPSPVKIVAAPPRNDAVTMGEKTNAYEPIKFYDDEVKRMHDELEKRDREQRAAAATGRPAAPRARATGVTLKGFLARVAVFYLLIAYFLVCPTDTTRARSVCRSLDAVHTRLAAYEPAVRPYVLTAQRKLVPYLARAHAKFDPYVAVAQPYYVRASEVARPFVARVRQTYSTTVHPLVLQGIHASQEATKPYLALAQAKYQKTLAPSVEWYSHQAAEWYHANAQPHLAVVATHLARYSKQAYDLTAPLYYQGLPFVKKHYLETVLPTAQTAFRTTRKTYVNEIHPRLLVAGSHTHAFYKAKVLPALQRFYSLYVAPQVGKISAKIFEYKIKKEKTDAVAHVVEAESKILEVHGSEDLEAFISELRDSTYVDPNATPVQTEASADPVDAAPTPEELKAATAEKRAALEALSTAYEKEIAKLGQVQQDLLIQRLAEIRSSATDDIPMRFTLTTTGLDEEGDKMVGRLGKYFDRVASDDKLSPEDKVKDAEFLAAKASAKVRKMAADALAEIADYRRSLETREVSAVELASEAMTGLVSKAQEELSFGWTWLDDVRHSDWQRFHQLAKAETNSREYFEGIRAGTIANDALKPYDPHTLLNGIEAEVNATVVAFEKILHKITAKGTQEIKGEWTGVANEAQKAFEKVVDVVEVVKSSASSLVGVTPTPTDLPGTASSLASVAQESASSLVSSAVEALPTIPVVPTDNIVDAYSSVVDAAGSAVESAAEAVVTVVPAALESVYSIAASLGEAAILGAGETASQIAPETPLASKVSAAAATLLNPKATKSSQAFADVVSSYVAPVSEVLSELTATAESLLAEATSTATSLASVASSLAAPHPAFTDSAVSAAASKAHAHEEL